MAAVIIKFVSGEEREGEVTLFNVNKPAFQLRVTDKEGKTEIQTIRTDSVKMVLFLKSLEKEGASLRTETIEQSIYAGTLAFKLRVAFKDGEVVNGSTLRYDPSEKGFFLVPLNPADKSERIYVNARVVQKVDQQRLFGRILVDQNKITSEQLVRSLKYHAEQKEKKIGAILREKAIINEKQLQESLQKQQEKNKMLGEILLEAGYISAEQLEDALHIQRENKRKKLGQVLVELKYITPNDICIALATQFHCPWVDLSRLRILPEIASSLPEDVQRRLEVIPIEIKEGGVLLVATSQPQDPEIKVEISKYTPLKVELVAAYEVYIEDALNSFYSSKV